MYVGFFLLVGTKIYIPQKQSLTITNFTEIVLVYDMKQKSFRQRRLLINDPSIYVVKCRLLMNIQSVHFDDVVNGRSLNDSMKDDFFLPVSNKFSVVLQFKKLFYKGS